MYATVRRDEGAASEIHEDTQGSRRLLSDLGSIPGFISCVVLDSGDGALVSIGICEDPASLEQVDRLIAGWLASSVSQPATSPPRITTGQVILQKGL